MPGERTFGYDPAAGAAGLASFALVDAQRSTTAALAGSHLQQGLMTLLFDAELLAAEAGLVPWVQLDDGSRGVFTIGAARDVIDTAPQGVKTLYLASHGVARRAHNEASDVTRSGAANGSVQFLAAEGIGVIPMVVPIVVLGVAAILATAYYATAVGEKMVQTKSTELKYAAKLDAMHKLAAPMVAAGLPLPSHFWSEFGDFSEAEEKRAVFPYLWGGAALAAAGVYWVWSRQGVQRVR